MLGWGTIGGAQPGAGCGLWQLKLAWDTRDVRENGDTRTVRHSDVWSDFLLFSAVTSEVGFVDSKKTDCHAITTADC